MKNIRLTIRSAYTSSRTHKIGAFTWRQLALAFVATAGLMAIFVQLVEEVSEGETLAIDGAILQWFRGLHTPWLDGFVSVMTDVGGTVGVALILLALVGLFVWKKKYQALWQLGLGVLGAVAINLILKNIFTRDRPDLWASIVNETSYSFPSGHAMASSAVALSVILIFWQTRYRWLITVLAVDYMLFVGATRLYLGVHYPTDILGGWVMSSFWVIVVAVIIGTLRIKSVRNNR